MIAAIYTLANHTDRKLQFCEQSPGVSKSGMGYWGKARVLTSIYVLWGYCTRVTMLSVGALDQEIFKKARLSVAWIR